MTSFELSYVRPQDPPLRRWVMRAVENLSGRRRLLPVYDKWRRDHAGKSPTQWSDLLAMIGTRLDVDTAPDWASAIPAERLVIIANHPFGIADGIALLALAERLGRPYRILLNADFMRVPEMQPIGLPIDFAETREALATNLATRGEARRLLKEGVSILVFPAGGVATAESPFGKAEDLPWKLFAARLVQQSDATVLPVYFEGQNSPLFHFVSRYSLAIRLALLVSEFRHKVGSVIRVRVGAPVASTHMAAAAGGGAILDEMYLAVHRLAPGAEDISRATLLPRSPEQRRRYPWDPPPKAARDADGRTEPSQA